MAMTDAQKMQAARDGFYDPTPEGDRPVTTRDAEPDPEGGRGGASRLLRPCVGGPWLGFTVSDPLGVPYPADRQYPTNVPGDAFGHFGLPGPDVVPETTPADPPPPPEQPPASGWQAEPIVVESVELPTLDLGLRGAAVLHLQFLLKALTVVVDPVLGMQPSTLVTDAIFGHKTEAAVKSFQRANQITEDGVVGPVTYAKLFPR